jgi:hypothetical protein
MGLGGSLARGILHARLLFSLSLYETALRWFQYAQIHLTQPKKKKKSKIHPKHPGLSRGDL